MSENTEKVLQAALALSREEQADFLDAFQLAREGADDFSLSKEWMEEIQRRSDAYDRGEMKTFTWEEVRQSVRERFKDHE